MAAKKHKVLEVFDFSKWALQDIVKAPLDSVAASDPPPARWLGVQSLASIATGRDGKVIVCNAAKRNVHFAFGYVEGYRKETHIVMPLDAPRAVMNLFSKELAKKVLTAPSFVTRLEEAGGGDLGVGRIIDGILAELDICTPEELEAMKAFCATCGFVGEEVPLRVSRVDGKLVMALIDAVMLAKKCTYAAAQHICHRLLLDHWHFDMETNGILGQPDLASQVFHSIRLQGGSHGGGATICVGPADLAEVLILIPGCELSAQLRKDMVRSFFGVGGNEVTFEGLLSNPRIQAHLRGSDHPLGEFLEEGEHKVLMRRLPRLLLQRDEELKARDEQWQQIVLHRDEQWQQIVLHRDEEWRKASLEQRSRDDAWRTRLSEVVEAWVVDARRTSEALAALGTALASLPFRLGQKISDVVSAAVMSPGSALVKNLRAATKKAAVRSTHSARRFPSEQKATQLEVLSSLVSLLSVAVRFFPEMHYDVWKAARGGFGKAAKKERVRRNGLDAASSEYVDRPLLWSFAGEGTAEGGGQRYVFLQRHVGLLEAVWTTPRSVGSGLRRRVESLDAKARRLQADATARQGYVPEPWPLLSAEVEPDFDSSGEDE